jgi:hypothetical protein
VADGILYVGGDFTRFGGRAHAYVAAIDLATAQILAWDPQVDEGNVSAILEKNGVIYLGGGFHSIGGHKIRHLAAVESARRGPGKVLAHWQPDPDKSVAALERGPGNSIFVGGQFSRIAGSDRRHIAAVTDADKGAAQALEFNPDPDQRVTSVVWDPANPGQVWAGGYFSRIAGTDQALLARLDPGTGRPAGTQPVIEGSRGREILRLILHRGVLYAAGVEIGKVNGQPRSNAFALGSADGGLLPFHADLDAGAGALTAAGNYIYLGGDFNHVNGQVRRAAAVHWQTGEVSDWDPKPDHNTYALQAWENGVFMSGYWNSLLGSPTQGPFAYMLDTNQPPAKAPAFAFINQY